MSRKLLRAALLVLGVLVTTSAFAQDRPWNPYGLDAYREGPGVKLGNSSILFHPGINIEAGYDSNVFYQPSNAVGSALLRLRLHADLTPVPTDASTPSTALPTVDFRLSGQLEYREYLSRNGDVQNQRSINAIVSGFVTLFPRGHFSLRLDEDYLHTVDPRNGEYPTSFSREYNRAVVTAIGRPGGGRLEFGASEGFVIQHYDDADVAFGNNVQNEARLFAAFHVFPRTILSFNARVGYIHYDTDPALEQVPLRVSVELESPLTTWLAGTVMIGYGNSFALHSTRFSSAISREELRFYLPLGIGIDVGHRRDFSDTLLASYFVDDAIYLGYQQPFLKRLRLVVDAQVRFRRYDGVVDPALFGYAGYSSTSRSDVLYDVHAGFSAQVLRWLVVGAVYTFVADRTDFQVVYANGSRLGVEYYKHTALAQIDVAY